MVGQLEKPFTRKILSQVKLKPFIMMNMVEENNLKAKTNYTMPFRNEGHFFVSSGGFAKLTG
jgi:hypothetical protein